MVQSDNDAIVAFFDKRNKGNNKSYKSCSVTISGLMASINNVNANNGMNSPAQKLKKTYAVDDGWNDFIEEEEPEGLLIGADAITIAKVAELKEDGKEDADPQIGETMEREAAKAEFWNTRKKQGAKKPKVEVVKPVKTSWRDRRSVKSGTSAPSLSSNFAFPTLGVAVGTEAMHAAPKKTGPKASINVWAKLADDDDEEEEEEEVAVTSTSSKSAASSKEDIATSKALAAAAKAKAEDDALNAAMAEVASAPSAPKEVDARFANKKKKKKKKKVVVED
jgi:hypothetical protein